MFKDFIRYFGGKIFGCGILLPYFKNLYFLVAQNYLNSLNSHTVKACWIRRSLTGQDFTPLWSDIDITLLVNEKSATQFTLPSNILVKDIQIVSDEHLSSWINSGGYRNRQITNWIQLSGSVQILPPPEQSSEILAFELAHESFLLYQQLEEKLHQPKSKWLVEGTYKLIAELDRVLHYWVGREERFLFVPREEVLPRNVFIFEHISSYLSKYETIWEEIFAALAPELKQFKPEEYFNTHDSEHQILNLSIKGRQVLLVRDVVNVPYFIGQFPNHFVCSTTFLKMIKGVGVQEQSLLNNLAKTGGYYYQFNLQRLANDLLGTMLLNPTNKQQLFYCLKNINDFYLVLKSISVPGWHQIESNWSHSEIPKRNSQELLVMCPQFLEVLRSLR
jgi:hypothetical protein